jgi:endo-1,4-beta-D-glucanase Y
MASAPHGAASDWIDYRSPAGFTADAQTHGVGSYDAIRVYLWAGTLSGADPTSKSLARQLAPVITLAAQRAAPPEVFDTDTMRAHGDGSPGFSAALMPLLAGAKATDALRAYQARVASAALQSDQHYYSDVLSLFGMGWIEARYRFDRDGELIPQWTVPCDAH